MYLKYVLSNRVAKSFIQYRIVIVATYFADFVEDKSVDEYELRARVFVDIVAMDEVKVSMTLVSRVGTESVFVTKY